MKTYPNWEIDDTVYFVNEAMQQGEFPKIIRGYVEEITRASLRIRLSKNQTTCLLVVDKRFCFKNLSDLCFELKLHIDSETKRLCGSTFL